MKIEIELTEADLRMLVLRELREKTGLPELKDTDVEIMVKSKQNYKSEWERAEFRATVKKLT